MIFFVSSSSISDPSINNERLKFLMTSKLSPCLGASSDLSTEALAKEEASG